MAVTITFSTSSGAGDPISSCQTLSKTSESVPAGEYSDAVDLYISHDGTSEITSCGLFIQPYTGAAYTGANGQQADYDEIIGWGNTYRRWYQGRYWDDGVPGGFQVSQDDGSTYTTLQSREGIYSSPLTLASTAEGSGSEGQIDVYTAPHPVHGEAHIKVRILVPANETTPGLRFVDFGLKYTYTS